MHQVAEFSTAERIVAEILDDGPSVRIGVGIPDLIFRQPRISLEQQGPNRVGPEQVNNFLVGQNGVRGRTVTADQHDEKNRQYADRKHAPAPGFSA